MTAKHRRRLRRLGWERALEPPDDGLWAAGDPPPREGCSLEVLVDGARGAAGDRRGDAERARLRAHHRLAPRARTSSSSAASRRSSSARCSPSWPSASTCACSCGPARRCRPSTRRARRCRRPCARSRAARASAARSIRASTRSTATTRRRSCIDGELAFVNGIDLTDDAGDRFDSSAHRARRRLGWHDVGTRLRGPAVADVHDHFAGRWYEVTGERLERPGPPAPAGDSTVQVVRTVAEDMYDDFPQRRLPDPRELHARAAQRAAADLPREPVPVVAGDRRDPGRQAAQPAAPRLPPRRPAARQGQQRPGLDTRGQLSVLAAADDHAGRFLAATIRSRTGEREDPLYVHAKVGIVDDRWLTVGSANLNAHSLLNDTEMNVVTDDAALARATRVRLWAEHLELEPDGDRRRRPGVGRRRALAPHRRRAARAPRARRAAHASPHRAARRLEALGAASSARCEGLTDDG